MFSLNAGKDSSFNPIGYLFNEKLANQTTFGGYTKAVHTLKDIHVSLHHMFVNNATA